MADPMLTVEEIANQLGVGRTTLYRALGRTRTGGTAAKTASKARAAVVPVAAGQG
jgi:transposase